MLSYVLKWEHNISFRIRIKDVYSISNKLKLLIETPHTDQPRRWHRGLERSPRKRKCVFEYQPRQT